MNTQTILKKKVYQAPKLCKHAIDRDVSFIMMSLPPGDPEGARPPYQGKDSGPEEMSPFRDNPFE